MPKILDSNSAKPGDLKPHSGATAQDGWLLCSGLTIGNSGSGATALASPYARDLFVHLWNNYADAQLPVSGGRTGSGLADFNLSKTIQLPDIRGRGIVGKDNMGGSTAGRITGAGSGITGTTLGATGGTETHTLSTAQMPLHKHVIYGATGPAAGSQNSLISAIEGEGITLRLNTAPANISAAMDNTGSGSTHQNTQPTFVATFVIKY